MSYDNYNPWNGRSVVYTIPVDMAAGPQFERHPVHAGPFARKGCLIMTAFVVIAIVGIVVAIVVPTVLLTSKSSKGSSSGGNNGGNNGGDDGGAGDDWKEKATGCSASGPPFKGLDFVYKDFGPFWERKIRTYYRQLNYENNGIVTKQTYAALGQRPVDLLHMTDTEAKQLILKMTSIFDVFFTDIAVNGGVTEDMFLEGIEKNQVYLRDAVVQFYALWFDVMDDDGDGAAMEDDFMVFFRMFETDESLAADSFKALDTDHDGKILQGEFVTMGNEFWMTEDESLPSKLLHGPLIEV